MPEEIQRRLSDLVATSTMTGRILDIYEAAGLIELAKEVAAEVNRGQRFAPPPNDDELAFYAVSTQLVGRRAAR